ncbi:MAG TPA: ATP-binding protein [Chthoniobacterales bacterium]|nr:ATP-binding protein [Chthoniobacterales bacterium]
MKVQTKILLLLVLLVLIFISALAMVRLFSERRLKAIADERAAERTRSFDEFLAERGDRLSAIVDDSTNWDDLVRALKSDDYRWADTTISLETLATKDFNAVWIYKPDLSLFHSKNNRYAESLREAPIPREALQRLLGTREVAHFFVNTPEGWMELRGGTIHPSRDRFRETTAQGYFLAGRFWIDENIRQMSAFTGYSIQVVPAEKAVAEPKSAEEQGLITFRRTFPGWDGRPVAELQVKSDSPLIREFNRTGRHLFIGLILFAAGLLLILSISMIRWVRRPLHLISSNLENQNPEGLTPLAATRNEFGRLAQLILKFRATEHTLHLAEEQLRHSQKLEAVGRLAGGIAHDFNNLLTAIIGYSELIEKRGGGAVGEHAHSIRKAGEQAAALTRQLLAFSRKQLLEPRVLDLNVLVRDMEKLLQRVIGESIHIMIDPVAQGARVRADPSQLEQVLLNLGVNARDAMPGGGTLSIATQEKDLSREEIDARGIDVAPGRYVLLIVSDTGSGMDAETQSRIFEPFFTTKGPGKGTGLGLATVYGIVKQSGGGITVESTPGQGCTFSIFLPATSDALDIVELPPADQKTHGSETILVVEDEEVVRHLICTVLGEAGYDVLEAESPAVALQLARERDEPVHLLLTDVVMPGMNGPALARTLSTLQPSLKVLYVSGYSDNDISAQGVVDPALVVLQKPFTQQTLGRKVREILDSDVSAESIG